MSKYRKIDPRIWNDENFRPLSDKAKLLFVFLLTHPHMTSLGAMRATPAGLRSELGWREKDFDKAFNELFRKPFLKVDKSASFLWIPKFIKYNQPENPNVLKSWESALDYIPECDYKYLLIEDVKAFVEGFGKAFREALPKAFVEGFRKPLANHEQEQEQEQEQIKPPTPFARGNGSNPLFEIYKEKNYKLAPCIKLTEDRKKKCQDRLKDPEFKDSFSKAVAKAQSSEFLTGSNNRGWKADFDWFIKNDKNIYKVLEGKYTGMFDIEEDSNGESVG